MATLWFGLVVFLLGTYVVLDGFDRVKLRVDYMIKNYVHDV